MAHIYQINSSCGEVRKGTDIVSDNMDVGEWLSINVYELRAVFLAAADV